MFIAHMSKYSYQGTWGGEIVRVFLSLVASTGNKREHRGEREFYSMPVCVENILQKLIVRVGVTLNC